MHNKHFLVFFALLLFVPLFTIAQAPDLPELPHIIAQNSGSPLYQELKKKQTFSIVYSETSYWANEATFDVLTLRKGEWKLEEWSMTTRNGEKDLTRISSLDLESNQKLKELLNFWQENRFFSLDNSLLNKTSEVVNDTTTLQYFVKDCSPSSFEVFTSDTYLPVYAKCPRVYQEKIPNEDRASFIKCEDKFISVLKELKGYREETSMNP